MKARSIGACARSESGLFSQEEPDVKRQAALVGGTANDRLTINDLGGVLIKIKASTKPLPILEIELSASLPGD